MFKLVFNLRWVASAALNVFVLLKSNSMIDHYNEHKTIANLQNRFQ